MKGPNGQTAKRFYSDVQSIMVPGQTNRARLLVWSNTAGKDLMAGLRARKVHTYPRDAVADYVQLMRKLFDQYQAANPGVVIEIETGGATSELQRQYLSTVLNAKDSAIDLFLIDIVNPAQYASKGWIEPLDKYVGGKAIFDKDYLPVYAQSNVVDGKVMALPSQGDSMFMYYRKDLLTKHGVAEPKTWEDLAAAAKKITAAEGNANLQGLSIQGAPIEGAVCTFLLPYWGQGKDFNDAAGKMTLDLQPFRIDELLRDLSAILSANIGSKNVEVLFNIDPALPRRLVGDAMRLQRVSALNKSA